jgi:hypothetical protein
MKWIVSSTSSPRAMLPIGREVSPLGRFAAGTSKSGRTVRSERSASSQSRSSRARHSSTTLSARKTSRCKPCAWTSVNYLPDRSRRESLIEESRIGHRSGRTLVSDDLAHFLGRNPGRRNQAHESVSGSPKGFDRFSDSRSDGRIGQRGGYRPRPRLGRQASRVGATNRLRVLAAAAEGTAEEGMPSSRNQNRSPIRRSVDAA